MYNIFVKRGFDLVVSGTLLILLSPIFIFLTLVLTIANNGKPFFRQIRPGRYKNLFEVMKFRTMNDKRDAEGKLLPDAQRLTRIGKFVRKTSMDELPQLINVLKGDMSIIGPRPLLVEYLPLYSQEQRRRHDVKPGITGWAQVNGRNTLAWKERLKLDVWYVDHVSFSIDVKIFWLTIIKVFKAEGISGENSLTMEKFRGNQI